MKNVTPPDPRRPRVIGVIVLGVIVVLLCVLFPRVLAFTELAARELRYFWWLILLVALGGYFFFFFGRKKD
jgi:H+/Cl- antiporter ClcA